MTTAIRLKQKLLNISCPRWYVGRGPDTMIVVTGDVLRTASIRLLKSFFSVSVCRSLVSLTPTWITTAAMLSSSFRIMGICAETSRTRVPGKQCVCTLPSANVAWTCRTSCSIWRRGAKRLRVEISKTGGGRGGEVVAQGLDRVFRCCTQGLWFPKGYLGRSRPGCTWTVQRNTRSRGGGSVSSSLSVSPRCFHHCSPLPQLGLVANLLLHGLQVQLHRM